MAQPEVMAWGNLTGIRVDGQLMRFETSLCVVEPGWRVVRRTEKEQQPSRYTRDGAVRRVDVELPPFRATQAVAGSRPGLATVEVRFTAEEAAEVEGGFFLLEVPAADYSGASVEVSGSPGEAVPLEPGRRGPNEYLRKRADWIRFVNDHRRLELRFDVPTEIIVRNGRRHGNDDYQVFVKVVDGPVEAGQSGRRRITIQVSGEVDRGAVTLALDVSHPGRQFDGIGGNFRLQNPDADAGVIDYNLKNLRVAWGRVEMPWQLWDPDEEADALAAARAGEIHPQVRAAMEMAQRLARTGVPIVVSAWFAPQWAVLGPIRGPEAGDGPHGNPLDPGKVDRILESLTGYLLFLKEQYGVEAALFSFNEPDVGIDVRQSPKEHANFIRTLGPDLAARGLATKMLLGDTSDPRSIGYIKPAMRDRGARSYIGAVSFHSWRRCTEELLRQWGEAARTLDVPLLIGEGSIDAAAWQYPAILREPSFALEEIRLYARICAISQPQSILEWQLTSDYSLLTGGPVDGSAGQLRPTQRFWNLKQLASTPEGAVHLPIKTDRPDVNAMAFGNITTGAYAVHVVNSGAARRAVLTGLPAGVTGLRMWVTDSQRGMEEQGRVPVSEGTAEFMLDDTSFTTLSTGPTQAAGAGSAP